LSQQCGRMACLRKRRVRAYPCSTRTACSSRRARTCLPNRSSTSGLHRVALMGPRARGTRGAGCPLPSS
jgi:hypothetical protein